VTPAELTDGWAKGGVIEAAAQMDTVRLIEGEHVYPLPNVVDLGHTSWSPIRPGPGGFPYVVVYGVERRRDWRWLWLRWRTEDVVLGVKVMA